MNRPKSTLAILLVSAVAVCSQRAGAADIRWLDDVDQGLAGHRQQDRPMLLYVTRDGCKYCVKMERGTYRDDRVTSQVNESFRSRDDRRFGGGPGAQEHRRHGVSHDLGYLA